MNRHDSACIGDGGPAFPSPSFAVPRSLDAEHIVKLRDMQGMTLRDYFAAKAMQGFLAEAANPRFGVTQEPPNAVHWTAFAQDAYLLADAMLAARGAK